MFESINEEAIRICLRDNNYDVERTIDTLLNLTALLPNRTSNARTVSSASPPLPNPSIMIRQPPQAETPNNSHYASLNQLLPQTTVTNNISNEDQLMKYVQSSNLSAIDAYLEKNAKSKPNDPFLHSLVLVAIQSGNSPMMSLLITKGEISADGHDSMISTPLLLAIETRSVLCAVTLLEKYNANPNKTNTSYTPIYLASKIGDAQGMLPFQKNLIYFLSCGSSFEERS
jgi:hypothetical protein